MAGVLGSLLWGIVPRTNMPSSPLRSMTYKWTKTRLFSANDPIRYQIIWSYNNITEGEEPLAADFTGGNGALVNVIFYVYATTKGNPPPALNTDWDLAATIKKSRDITNKHYNTKLPPVGHRFTIDISQICSDLLSYSLVPTNKGTWQSAAWGGMNGGLTMQDNVTINISPYNVSPNGSYRTIKIVTEYEIINADGEIELSTLSHDSTSADGVISVINSVNQFERDSVYYGNESFDRNLEMGNKYAINYAKGFMSRCPNESYSTASEPWRALTKNVRMDEGSEWLYFYIKDGMRYSAQCDKIYLKIEPVDTSGAAQTVFYVDDFASTLDSNAAFGLTYHYKKNQWRVCVQNVSVLFLNANALDSSGASIAGSIDSTTDYYTVSLYYHVISEGVWYRMSNYRWYKIDREREMVFAVKVNKPKPFDFVRFHWLNSLGGIDSYTAKRDIIDGYSISRDVIDRKSGDRNWQQAYEHSPLGSINPTGNYISNTMRGGDTYKGGREVMNVNAENTHSVYTQPLNTSKAKWLEEILLSPNVWIETTSAAAERANQINPFQRPRSIGGVDMIVNGDFSSTANWTPGTGWSIGGGNATHASGSSGYLEQTLTGSLFHKRQWYSITYTVGNRTTGNLLLANHLEGNANGFNQSQNGTFTYQWQQGYNNLTKLSLYASSTFDGNVDNVIVQPLNEASDYVPVIITNSDIETVNQSEGLVKFNLEYTLAHQVKTQRN